MKNKALALELLGANFKFMCSGIQALLPGA
jgi:hypothetical protein